MLICHKRACGLLAGGDDRNGVEQKPLFDPASKTRIVCTRDYIRPVAAEHNFRSVFALRCISWQSASPEIASLSAHARGQRLIREMIRPASFDKLSKVSGGTTRLVLVAISEAK